MKVTSVAAVLSLAAATSAQFNNLPSCAVNCFLGPLKTDGCKLTDFKCHCEKDTLIPKVQPCVEQKCSDAQQDEVISAAEMLCKQYGVTLTLSNPGSPSTTSGPSSPTTSVTVHHPNNGTATITKPSTHTTHKTDSITKTNTNAGSPTGGSGSGSSSAPDGAAATAGFGNYLAFAGAAAALAGL